MDWSLAVAQAVVIAALSALISYLVARRQKNLDFTYDYRKYILDKRKEAYSKVEVILNGFQDIHLSNGKIIQRFYQLNEAPEKDQFSPLSAFNDLVIDAIRSSIWMTTRMTVMLEYINFTFIMQMQELAQKGMTPAALTEIAIRDNSMITHMYVMSIDMYLDDLMRLDDIDEFKKMKKRETLERVNETRQSIVGEINKKMAQHH